MPAAVRRLLALLTGAMMLVLVLAESGFACAKPAMVACAGADAAGLDMTDMTDMTDADAPSSTVPVPGSDETPCRFPWAPAGCQSSAPCAPAALAVAAWHALGVAAPRAAPWSAPSLAWASFDAAPELPPPRA